MSGICRGADSQKEKKAQTPEKSTQPNETAMRDLLEGREYLSRDGLKEADADIAQGKLKYKLCGRELADVYRQARDKIFMDRFRVQQEQIAGCMVNGPLVTYVEAYNARILRYVTEKYGKNAWQEAERESVRQIDAIQKKKKG